MIVEQNDYFFLIEIDPRKTRIIKDLGDARMFRTENQADVGQCLIRDTNTTYSGR
jgi:hypothetical protein